MKLKYLLLLVILFGFFIAGYTIVVQSNNIVSDKNLAEDEIKLVKKSLRAFHQAIKESDKPKAYKLLTKDSQILEFGIIESKEHYFKSHFYLDGEFKRAMNRKIIKQIFKINNSVAWVATKSRIWGSYENKVENLNSLELAVLEHKQGQWKISSLHWSSSKRK